MEKKKETLFYAIAAVIGITLCAVYSEETNEILSEEGVFADEYIAHGDVVLGVAGDDFDFTDRQWLAQVHGKVMFLADTRTMSTWTATIRTPACIGTK